MAYFANFSDYNYKTSAIRPGTKNIGWLNREYKFETMIPSEDILDNLWEYCKISVMQMRGVHVCDICGLDESTKIERNGIRLWLGSAEIRVFSEEGDIYAAPNLIFHYVYSHHYKLPDKFIRALMKEPKPLGQAYFEKLNKLNIEWKKTLNPPANAIRFRLLSGKGEREKGEIGTQQP